MAFGIMGIPSHSLDGFPDGIGRTGADGVSVGGIGVSVGGIGVSVGVVVGSDVFVEVGKLVWVGIDVSVGCGTKVLQDASVMTRTESIIALSMVFIYFLTFVFIL